jgi:flagellin|tara:strand:- start:6013 stop:6852 length:840 start_codon:yes stop_codon:yes gene_type:complete
MTVINTNNAATLTSNALLRNERAMTTSMERLSTGQRINSAQDDAAGLAIASKMTSSIRGLEQATRNSNDAISLLQTADGAAIEISNVLQRMRELAVQYANGTLTATDQSAIDTEFTSLQAEVTRIADNTTWNGTQIMDGTGGTTGTFVFQVGADDAQTISVSLGDFNSNVATTYSSGTSTSLGAIVASTATAIADLDVSIAGLNTQRATFGATMNRLEYTVDNLQNIAQNTESSRSRIMDTNYAAESTELARTQIIQQAATAMLAQANQSSQSVLSLLK